MRLDHRPSWWLRYFVWLVRNARAYPALADVYYDAAWTVLCQRKRLEVEHA